MIIIKVRKLEVSPYPHVRILLLTAAIVNFSYTNVSQVSPATQLRCGGMVEYLIMLFRVPVKGF